MALTLLLYPGPADRRYTDPLALPIFTDQRPPRRVAGRVDWRRSGLLSRWLEDHPWRESDFHLIQHPGKAFPSLLLRPCGSFDELSGQRIVKIIADLTATLARAGAARFSLGLLDLFPEDYAIRDFAEDVFEGLVKGLSGHWAAKVEAIRLLWREQDAEPLLRELRRFRHHLPNPESWEVILDTDGTEETKK
jgi:hypothetical protein